MVTKCTVFDICNQIWYGENFDHFYFVEDKKSNMAVARKQISFREFSLNKASLDYVQEFNRLNDYQPHINIYNSVTKDILTVNKGFIYGLFDQDEEEQENKF